MTSLTAEPLTLPNIEGVIITDDTLSVDLADGRTISVPLAWYPRLLHGTTQERNNWQLIGKGQGIYWPDLDEDISCKNLIFGQPSAESQKSLQRWLDERLKTDEKTDTYEPFVTESVAYEIAKWSQLKMEELSEKMNYTIELDQEEDGRIIAEIRELPGVLTYGVTKEEAIAKVQALALRVLADKLEHGETTAELLNLF